MRARSMAPMWQPVHVDPGPDAVREDPMIVSAAFKPQPLAVILRREGALPPTEASIIGDPDGFVVGECWGSDNWAAGMLVVFATLALVAALVSKLEVG